MTKKSIFKDLYALIPSVFSGFLCISLTFVIWQKSDNSPEFTETLYSFIGLFVGISGFIGFSILAYIFFTVFGIQRLKSSANDKLSALVQKMNIVREIADILLDSKLWLPDIKEYMDVEFEGLNYFEVKEFYKGKSKLAIEFLQEKRNFEDTETLYLELKSLLMIDPKQKKIPNTITFPDSFKTEILEKWIEHKVGSGLWYYFGYKFGTYRNALDIEGVFERHQNKIITLANSIDSDLFEESSFNEVFFSKLGEYINKDLLPKLYEQQKGATSQLPEKLRILYTLFTGTILIGVILPLLFLLFQLPVFTLIFSYSFVISILFFLLITIFPFLQKNLQ